MTYKKKLIEVAIPLIEINNAAIKEKENPFIKGHIKNIHPYWARMPLTSSIAVLFSQMMDDPSESPEQFPTKKLQDKERKRLFKIIELLSDINNINKPEILNKAIKEIKSCCGNLPSFLDPFAGGGTIPYAALKLGLNVYSSDLNPLAVLINKALIEFPIRWKQQQAINPGGELGQKKLFSEGKNLKSNLSGLAQDIKYYGKYLHDLVDKELDYLYPKIKLTSNNQGDQANVLAWLWARTVKSPNPICKGVVVPLIKTFQLSNKKGDSVWLYPEVNTNNKTYSFNISNSRPKMDGTISRHGGVCLISNTPISLDYIRQQGEEGLIGYKLIAIVAKNKKGKIYLPPSAEQEKPGIIDISSDLLDTELPKRALGFRVQKYGFKKYRDFFLPRQLLTLSTFSKLMPEVKRKIEEDIKGRVKKLNTTNFKNEADIIDYSKAIITYLSLALSKLTDYSNALCTWNPMNQNIGHLFNKQAVPMCWDFAEANILAGPLSYYKICENIASIIENNITFGEGYTTQENAINLSPRNQSFVISTDPPYYDNVAYIDLSNFFYVWLRLSLREIYPELFKTITISKSSELIADKISHCDSQEKADLYFLENMTQALKNISSLLHPDFPITIYYAYKQTETNNNSGSTTTGWTSFLKSIINSDLSIEATWPIMTARANRMRGIDSNALSSSILLVCRKILQKLPAVSTKEFLLELKKKLPTALETLQMSNIAPVDFSQAAMGPGMAIYSRYSKIIEPDGSKLSIENALKIIIEKLDEFLQEQDNEYDLDTRFAITWFEEFGLEKGAFGVAETLAKARNISVNGVVEAGILEARSGKVRLLKREELLSDWDPHDDKRLTVWESVQYLIKELQQSGESGAASLLYKLGTNGELARDLAYRLYGICERKKWTEEALAYNSLVVSWTTIAQMSNKLQGSEQIKLGV